jgi:metal-responsive CopG/Arc/MetJ family transcriptional regulator
MRITVYLSDNMAEELKKAAVNANLSASGLVAEALKHYLITMRRRAAGEKILGLAGKTHVGEKVHDELERGRRDDRV